MTWILNNNSPIYLQIVDKVRMNIIAGIYKPGDKLPSVRDLATEASVNPNTMQKAMSELERLGLVYSQRTSGRYITDDLELIHQMKEQLAKEQISKFYERMKQLGFQKEEILNLMEELIREEI